MNEDEGIQKSHFIAEKIRNFKISFVDLGPLGNLDDQQIGKNDQKLKVLEKQSHQKLSLKDLQTCWSFAFFSPTELGSPLLNIGKV